MPLLITLAKNAVIILLKRYDGYVQAKQNHQDKIILEGWVSIRAAFVAKKRKIYKLIIQKDKSSKMNQILIRRAKAQKVKIEYLPASKIFDLARGKSHGGALALVSGQKLASLKDLAQAETVPYVAMLDGIEDPFNLGQAIRSLYASGVHGIVLRKRNWDFAAATIARSSAGASELVDRAEVNNAYEAAEHFKSRDFKIIYTGLEDRAVSIYNANFSEPIFIIIGGEKRGINNKLKEIADTVVKIPYGRDFRQSLDASSSSAVIAFEVLRQRSR